MVPRSNCLVGFRFLVVAWMMIIPWVHQVQAASPRLNFT